MDLIPYVCIAICSIPFVITFMYFTVKYMVKGYLDGVKEHRITVYNKKAEINTRLNNYIPEDTDNVET